VADGSDHRSTVMMRPVGEVRVYLHRAPIDMRRYALTMVMHFEPLPERY
jgi:hypothetical protein